MEKPLVSIIIPVYNGADYVGEAIESALAQTYENKEIVVVNDGSNDDGATEKVVLSYGDRVRYFYKENGGVSTALNRAIHEAKGEWISWLSHDDLYTPDKVEVQMADVEKVKAEGLDPLRTLFYCGAGFMDAEGKRIERKTRTLPDGHYKGADMLLHMFKGFGIGGCGLLMPKTLFDEVGGFDERMRYMQDVFMWEKSFLAGYGFYMNNKVMSITRVHRMQTSTTGQAYARVDREKVGMYLAEHLQGVMSTDSKDVLKQYLFLCMRNNSLNVGSFIYKNLKNAGKLSFLEKCWFNGVKLYGMLRRKMVAVYYRVRFNTKR